jgi:hypothetical protein
MLLWSRRRAPREPFSEEKAGSLVRMLTNIRSPRLGWTGTHMIFFFFVVNWQKKKKKKKKKKEIKEGIKKNQNEMFFV